MDLQALLSLMEGSNLESLASQLKVGNNEAKSGLLTALPSIMNALSKNTSTAEGAQALSLALDKNHDGSILNNLSAFLANPNLSEGAGILKHLFGNTTENVVSSVSNASGISNEGCTKLLQMLAPLVMGFLGKMKKEANLDASGLNGLISMVSAGLNSKNGADGLISALTSALDTDKDGSIADNLLNLAGGLFGKK